MKNHYYTLYSTSYGTVKAKLKDKMEFEKAEALGRQYCEDYSFEYYGSYTESQIGEAEDNLRKELYMWSWK